ncbi:FeoC-like transcriptional regulator [Vibrio ostreicida]|uniref:FeoC-like transcriptional regulator n=1 Tax=Vibrio ostreicida TaxID=526588 RepID=A0ABT8BTY7_9VIBR|nr:FeoC-like transcriptional regulator [Vibrio ostreicida]MDN3610631.1 FeoC-like transcriptional regulator [Vibrio ostreicida]NPD07371.1 iron transporter FeoC [Vibrio ostreicida]
MILQSLRKHIEQKGCVSQVDLAKRFSLSEDGVAAMLEVWVNRGKISRLVDTNKSGQVTRIRYSANRVEGLSLTVIM